MRRKNISLMIGWAMPDLRAHSRSIADLAPTEGIAAFAVNGPWGSGKTTAVNMIVEALDALQKSDATSGEVLPIRFNPWWFSGQEDLVKAFFAELSSQASTKSSPRKWAGEDSPGCAASHPHGTLW